MVHKHKTAKRIITYITCITAGTAFLLQALPCRAAVQTARAASGKTQGFEKIQELAAAGNAKAGILEGTQNTQKAETADGSAQNTADTDSTQAAGNTGAGASDNTGTSQASGTPGENAGVTFEQLNGKDVFLKQSQARVCTLAASAMMIRRAAMLSGNADWKQITEQSIRKSAWSEGSGLKWNFKAAGITVAHKTLSSKKELISLLDKHPEGIVIYNSRKPHAILITDYTDGVFYCSDPANNKPQGRYPVSQASITVESAGRCWYVKAPVGLSVGKQNPSSYPRDFAQGGLKYQVLDMEGRTAVCTGAVQGSESLTVPDTVMLDGVEFQVERIAQSAFAGSDKLKEVLIQADVEGIGPKAFYQCRKLKKLTINAARLKEIGADAFASVHKKAQILILGEQIETFAALLTGTSVPGTATVGLSPVQNNGKG